MILEAIPSNRLFLDILGSRLEQEGDTSMAQNACLCYICAGNVEKLVSCWSAYVRDSPTPDALQDLVEKVMVLRKAIAISTGHDTQVQSGVLAEKLSRYAELLAAQGCAAIAINYLGSSTEVCRNYDHYIIEIEIRLVAVLEMIEEIKPKVAN